MRNFAHIEETFVWNLTFPSGFWIFLKYCHFFSNIFKWTQIFKEYCYFVKCNYENRIKTAFKLFVLSCNFISHNAFNKHLICICFHCIWKYSKKKKARYYNRIIIQKELTFMNSQSKTTYFRIGLLNRYIVHYLTL